MIYYNRLEHCLGTKPVFTLMRNALGCPGHKHQRKDPALGGALIYICGKTLVRT
jgi:hypothetical protein